MKSADKSGARFFVEIRRGDTGKSDKISTVAWDDVARSVAGMHEGSRVRVVGALRRVTWVAKSSETRLYDTELHAVSVVAD